MNNIKTTIVVGSYGAIFIYDSNSLTFLPDHKYFDHAVAIALKYYDSGLVPLKVLEDLETKQDMKTDLLDWGKDLVEFKDSRVLFNGTEIPQELENHLITLYKSKDEHSLESWTKFLVKLQDVSHSDTYNRLYSFLKFNDLAVNKDGNILAWKVVTSDYKDKYTGLIDNSVGSIPTMSRQEVDHDPTRTCSKGLHACAFGYLTHFGREEDNLVLIEIDVRDIISVPTDYDGKKVRCCAYKVIHSFGSWMEAQHKDPYTLLDEYFLTEA